MDDVQNIGLTHMDENHDFVKLYNATSNNETVTDLPHDTDFPYVIRIIDDLRVIRPYHILIRFCFKYTENPYPAHTNDNRRFKIHLPTTATEKHTLLADPGGTWWNLYCPTDGASLFWKRPMKAFLSNVTGLPNAHRGCAEGSHSWFLVNYTPNSPLVWG